MSRPHLDPGDGYALIQAANHTGFDPGHGLSLTLTDTSITDTRGTAVAITCRLAPLVETVSASYCRLTLRNTTVSRVAPWSWDVALATAGGLAVKLATVSWGRGCAVCAVGPVCWHTKAACLLHAGVWRGVCRVRVHT